MEVKEENKDYHIKMGKFTEDNYVKIADWLMQKLQRKINQIRKIEMKETIMIQERMKHEYWFGETIINLFAKK